jgi:hypothetical protein
MDANDTRLEAALETGFIDRDPLDTGRQTELSDFAPTKYRVVGGSDPLNSARTQETDDMERAAVSKIDTVLELGRITRTLR